MKNERGISHFSASGEVTNNHIYTAGNIPIQRAMGNTETSENPETISAMQEARKIAKDPNAKTYDDADTLFADLL